MIQVVMAIALYCFDPNHPTTKMVCQKEMISCVNSKLTWGNYENSFTTCIVEREGKNR